jgi:hypothetical protein
MKPRFRSPTTVPFHLTWSHGGVLRRVRPWPAVRFERQCGAAWRDDDPTEDSLAAAAAAISPRAWGEFLEYLPAPQRAFLERFRCGRIAALQVLARCPDVAGDLYATPALACFLAAHQSLRGGLSAQWREINAIHERGGVFGLLEWLGLPALRRTLACLQQVADPDLPLRFLEPLRARLWEPGHREAA